MAKNAYLVTTDLHLNYKNMRSRVDYRGETNVVCQKLVDIANTYRKRGYNVVLLLLGDVFHGSYGDVFNACSDNNFFFMWKQTFGQIYSLVGNHELSYYVKNPFYTLVSSIESANVKKILNRVYKPVGTLDAIRVVDRLEDGDTVFQFNHYGTGIIPPENGVHNIGLFHQNLASSEIIQAAKSNFGFSWFANAIDIDGTGILTGYDYCFLGHAHTLYGTFKTDSGTILCYLGSLGRTSVTEVLDNFLERNIPVVRVEEGRLSGIDDNKFKLPDRASCIVEEQVLENKHVSAVQKERSIIKSTVSIGDDPVENVLSSLSDNALAARIFKELLIESFDGYGQELDTWMHKVLQKYIL